MKLDIKTAQDLEYAIELIEEGVISNKDIYLEIKEVTRTSHQNKAIHLYCGMVSRKLNLGGFDFVEVMKRMEVDIPATSTRVKEDIWRPIQTSMLEIKSTTKLKTKQVSEVYEVMNRFTSERFGFGVAFPGYFNQGRE